MIRLTLGDIAGCLGRPSPGRPVTIQGLSTDSRDVQPGMMFAALAGSRADGHDFAATAVKNGAASLLVSRDLPLDVPQIIVDDVLEALAPIAALWRQRVDPVVVGITGSNGKTTVKEMIASVLGLEARVLATSGNYNNELGVPLTLFGLDSEDRFAVLEMGASRAGDIRYLADIASPDIGIVTNVGPAHLAGFGDEEGVARAKGEMFMALPSEGCAVINADEPWGKLWRELNASGRIMSFGQGGDADVRFEQLGASGRILTDDGSFDLKLSLPGLHNLANAAAATAVCLSLAIPLSQIHRGLEAVKPVPGRLNLIHSDRGWTVIDDTYNANPASLYAALQVLTGSGGVAWLVLGDMKELGGPSRKLHREVGEAARALGVRHLFAIGEMSELAADAFGAGARHFEDRATLVEALLRDLEPGVTCLVKGSRSMGMEHVVKAITQADEIRETG